MGQSWAYRKRHLQGQRVVRFPKACGSRKTKNEALPVSGLLNLKLDSDPLRKKIGFAAPKGAMDTLQDRG